MIVKAKSWFYGAIDEIINIECIFFVEHVPFIQIVAGMDGWKSIEDSFLIDGIEEMKNYFEGVFALVS